MKTVDVLVIGGGPAGMAAALKARETGASVCILERDSALGGILQQCIHNGFGLHYFGEELTGPEYAGRFADKVAGTDIEVLLDTMALSVTPERVVEAVGPKTGYLTIKAGAIVLAMGCRERTRGALTIPGTRPAGVFTAGAAQRLANMEGVMPGRRVVILGSGDIGLIMARRMTYLGAKVEMVCELMSYSGGLTRNIVQCLEDNGIPLRLSTTVTRIHGRERVEGVSVCPVDPATKRPIEGKEEYIPCDTLLLSVGLLPENELSIGAGVELDRVTGGARVDERRETKLEGIFACGNVLHVHDLVDNVSHEAETAGVAAALYAAGKTQKQTHFAVTAGDGVRYTVPQSITQGADAQIFLRVTDVFKKAKLCVYMNGECVASRRKPVMTPGEMEKIEIKNVQGEVRVCIETEA